MASLLCVLQSRLKSGGVALLVNISKPYDLLCCLTIEAAASTIECTTTASSQCICGEASELPI